LTFDFFKLIRVQSPEGTKRFEIKKEVISSLYDKVYKEFSIDDNSEWSLYLDLNRKNLLAKSKTRTVDSVCKHGDLLFLLKSSSGSFASTASSPIQTTVEEDEVDRILCKQDGRIQRDRDEQL
jgi:hypothetical protein